MATFKHVLAATDFSETSGRALEMAVGIARDAGAELSVVHVCEIPPYTDFAAPLDLVTPASDLAQTKLDELLSSIRDVCPRVKGFVRLGAPWEEILSVATERGADLVVVGTHGRRGLAHALMGSVAERVVRLSTIPVLTVRSRIKA
jgi:nucleotide-binding universal stress UspA family protein